VAHSSSDALARIFAAHPLLDPRMLTRQRTAVRFWRRQHALAEDVDQDREW
jgi:hypothetical protein